VDDGSTDHTRRLLKDFAQGRPGIRCLFLEHVGPGAARSIGLKGARGRYVTFADADDEVNVQTLMRGCREADSRDADVVIFAYEKRPSKCEGRHDSRGTPLVERVSPSRVLTSRAAIWGKIYRTPFLRSHGVDFEPLRSADDVLFSWEVAAARPRTLESSDLAYFYFVHPHGQLTRDPQYFLDGVVSLRLLLERSRRRGTKARLLALYAWASGTYHILRKVPTRHRPEVLVKSSVALVRSARPSRKPVSS
jgi:CDP-glycerol glycerophosphotransferase